MKETNIFFPWFYKRIEGEEREKLLIQFKEDIERENKERGPTLFYGMWKLKWSVWENSKVQHEEVTN